MGVVKALFYGAFNFIGQFFVFGSMAVIIILGAKLQKDGNISIGDITSFLLQMMQLLLNFVMLASVFSTLMMVTY